MTEFLSSLRDRDLSSYANVLIVVIFLVAFLKYAWLQEQLPVHLPVKDLEAQEAFMQQSCQNVAGEPQSSPIRLQALENLAQFYEENGFYDKARPLYLQELECLRRSERSEGSVSSAISLPATLRKLGKLSRESGAYKESEDYFNQAFKIDDGANHSDRAAGDLRESALSAYAEARSTDNLENKLEKDRRAQKLLDLARQYALANSPGDSVKRALDNYQALLFIDQHDLAALKRLGVSSPEL